MTFLRPVYTKYLFKQLQKKSLNVYGAAGEGRERLLNDLQELAKPAGTLVLFANMKAFAKNYEGFIKELIRQLATQLNLPSSTLNLEELLDIEPPKTVWILLHNFDAVLNNTHLDKHFGIGFFNQLNSLKNRNCCFLLCVSEKPFKQYRFYTDEIHSLSPLDLELEKLTKLTREECEQELIRRQLGLKDDDFRFLLAAVYQHLQPYNFLDYVCKRIAAEEHKSKLFKVRLKIWGKQYAAQEKRGFLTWLEKFRNDINIATRELKLLGLALGGFTALLTLIYAKGQQIMDFVMQPFGK
jgi:hypothetical protein